MKRGLSYSKKIILIKKITGPFSILLHSTILIRMSEQAKKKFKSKKGLNYCLNHPFLDINFKNFIR